MKTKTYGIYEVSESFTKDGLWQGYLCSVATSSEGKQGKLYPKSDTKDHYKAKPDTEELEI